MPTYKPSKIRVSLALICVLPSSVACSTLQELVLDPGLIFGLWLVAHDPTPYSFTCTSTILNRSWKVQKTWNPW